MKRFLATLTLTSMFIGNAMAVDIIAFIPTLIADGAGSNVTYFKYSKSSATSISSNSAVIDAFLETIIIFPFALLSEKNNSLQVNTADLEQLNYSAEEITEYKNDIAKIQKLASGTTFSSNEEVAQAIQTLDLGIIAQEQMRLK